MSRDALPRRAIRTLCIRFDPTLSASTMRILVYVSRYVVSFSLYAAFWAAVVWFEAVEEPRAWTVIALGQDARVAAVVVTMLAVWMVAVLNALNGRASWPS